MLLDIKKIFSTYDAPVKVSEELDLSKEDFPGYEVPDSIHLELCLILHGNVLETELCFRAQAVYECARCLERSQQVFDVERSYPIRQVDLTDPDAELPFTEDGQLDTKELVYSELLLEIPTVLLCSDDCAGLCPVCGRKKPCACTHETNDATDERLSILKQLLS